jgi:hypothetical protein
MLSVTDAQLECLAGVTSLWHLFLNENCLTGAGLKHLVHLELHSLDLGNCRNFNAFEVLAEFQSLRVLQLMGAKIGDANQALDFLPQRLQDLDLWGSDLHDRGVAKLERLVHLQRLGMRFCRNVTDEALVVLRELRCLESVDIFRTSITEASMLSLPNIDYRSRA